MMKYSLAVVAALVIGLSQTWAPVGEERRESSSYVVTASKIPFEPTIRFKDGFTTDVSTKESVGSGMRIQRDPVFSPQPAFFAKVEKNTCLIDIDEEVQENIRGKSYEEVGRAVVTGFNTCKKAVIFAMECERGGRMDVHLPRGSAHEIKQVGPFHVLFEDGKPLFCTESFASGDVKPLKNRELSPKASVLLKMKNQSFFHIACQDADVSISSNHVKLLQERPETWLRHLPRTRCSDVCVDGVQVTCGEQHFNFLMSPLPRTLSGRGFGLPPKEIKDQCRELDGMPFTVPHDERAGGDDVPSVSGPRFLGIHTDLLSTYKSLYGDGIEAIFEKEAPRSCVIS